jgi:hypothetical protein
VLHLSSRHLKLRRQGYRKSEKRMTRPFTVRARSEARWNRRPNHAVAFEVGESYSVMGGPEMKRVLLFVAIGTMVMSGARPAAADPTRGPFRVMGPDGTVVRISGEAADMWWRDYSEAKYVSGGPRDTAAVLYTVETRRGRYRLAPRYLLLVESLGRSWPRAWIFYPSTEDTPAYVVKPGGIGSGVAQLLWDSWLRATPRMGRIILDATRASSSPAAAKSVREHRGDGSAPVAWIVASALLTALLAGLAIARRSGTRSREGRRGIEADRPRSSLWRSS